jgi:hypothetical protein
MFILPWLHRVTRSPTGTVTHIFQLFLENGGTQLLSNDTVEHSEAAVFCNQNGLVPLKQFFDSGIEYVKLNREEMTMSSFYSFHEKEGKGLEVWRTFVWIGQGEDDNPWGVNKYLDGISLSNIPVAKIIKTILRLDAEV